MKWFIFIAFACLWMACSSTPPQTFEAEAPPPPKPTVAEIPIDDREPGSLWTPNSKWNKVYSKLNERTQGSYIFVKPTSRFATLVENKGVIPDLKTGRKFTEEKNKIIVATIEEVLPRGLYRVKSDQRIWLEEDEEPMILEGKIRETDIRDDDSLSADSLFDLRMDLPEVQKSKLKLTSEKAVEQEKKKQEEEKLKAEEKAKEKAKEEAEAKQAEKTESAEATEKTEKKENS